jgi:hypothetical protein
MFSVYHSNSFRLKGLGGSIELHPNGKTMSRTLSDADSLTVVA